MGGGSREGAGGAQKSWKNIIKKEKTTPMINYY